MRLIPGNSITRRGLFVGAATVAAAAVIRARPDKIDAMPAPVDRGFATSPLLTTTAALQSALDRNSGVQLLDASRLADFRDSHIPGARHVWWQDTMELNTRWYGHVLKADDDQGNQGHRVRFLERLGIDSNRPVVIYDRTDGQAAARVCWFLTFLGLQAAVLDGGLRAWVGESMPTTSGAHTVPPSLLPVVRPQDGFYLLSETAAARIAAGQGQLLDLRTPTERQHGAGANLQVPGSLLLDRSTLLDDLHILRSRANLIEIFAAANLDLASPILMLGPTAIECSIAWLALRLCDAASVITIDGGWPEWVGERASDLAPL